MPHDPASRPTLELTVRAIVIGLVLSVVMGAANVYLGLYAGLTVSASIPAAVIGMVVLRGLFRNGTILEANQVQTAASAGESLAAGVIFTLPALVMLGVWSHFDFWLTTIIAFTGGLLGILFMIPMRRVFVVGPSDELKYPEGVACAAVLQAGEEAATSGASHILSILRGALYGGLLKLAIELHVLKAGLETAFFAGNRFGYVATDVSAALVAVGYIVRLNVAFLVFLGGAIAWVICLPLVSGDAVLPEATADAVGDYARSTVRYIGVGAMVVGGVAAIVSVRGSLVEAVRHLRRRPATGGAPVEEVPRTEQDLSARAITFWSIIASLSVGVVYYVLTEDLAITAVTTVIMIVMSFFFTAVASYIVGLVGNSNSPVSGMTITAVLFTGGMLILFGFSGTDGILATLGVAAIVCCAACTSGDVCNDLKTGSMVGATPRRQQIMQILGVAAAAFIMAPIMQLLHENVEGGIGGEKLSAPQAGLFKSLAEAFFGDGALPWDMLGIGAAIGLAMVAADAVLKARKANFRLYVMPIAVGMYLPFGLAPPILLGGILAWLVTRHTRSDAEADAKVHRGVLFSSGIIAGEALMGVLLAILTAAGLESIDPGLGDDLVLGLTVAVLIGLVVLFRFETKPAKEK